MAKQMAFYFDASACTDCKACQVACKDRSSLPVGVMWRRVIQYVGGNWTPVGRLKGVMAPNGVFSYSLSISCMHCENPVCVDGCPTGGMVKDENGIVYVEEDNCIGCRYCEWNCPYGAPQYNEERSVMTKCDFCRDLLAEGQNPACVDACVMRCLKYGELEELRAEYGDMAAIEPLPEARLTSPAFVVTPHVNAIASGDGHGWIKNLREEM
jgi:anaerobic dimethyl sulfoxide reductase subunit B (iron-sulfur subunit)